MTATAESGAQVLLSWTDASDGESSFHIERAVGSGTTWTHIGSTSGNVTRYLDTSGRPGATLRYRVRAYLSSGGGAYSSFAPVAEVNTPALAAPSGLKVRDVSGKRVDLAWADNSDVETGYVLERSNDGATWSHVTTTSADQTSYADSGLTAGRTYHYRLRADFYDYYGGSAGSAFTPVLIVTTTPLAAPSTLTATAVDPRRVELTWADHSDGEGSFEVERSEDGGANWSNVTSTYSNQTSVVDTGVGGGRSYLYRVRASAYGSPTYAYSAFSPTAAASTPLAAPYNLRADAVVTGGTSQLSWYNPEYYYR